MTPIFEPPAFKRPSGITTAKALLFAYFMAIIEFAQEFELFVHKFDESSNTWCEFFSSMWLPTTSMISFGIGFWNRGYAFNVFFGNRADRLANLCQFVTNVMFAIWFLVTLRVILVAFLKAYAKTTKFRIARTVYHSLRRVLFYFIEDAFNLPDLCGPIQLSHSIVKFISAICSLLVLAGLLPRGFTTAVCAAAEKLFGFFDSKHPAELVNGLKDWVPEDPTKAQSLLNKLLSSSGKTGLKSIVQAYEQGMAKKTSSVKWCKDRWAGLRSMWAFPKVHDNVAGVGYTSRPHSTTSYLAACCAVGACVVGLGGSIFLGLSNRFSGSKNAHNSLAAQLHKDAAANDAEKEKGKYPIYNRSMDNYGNYHYEITGYRSSTPSTKCFLDIPNAPGGIALNTILRIKAEGANLCGKPNFFVYDEENGYVVIKEQIITNGKIDYEPIRITAEAAESYLAEKYGFDYKTKAERKRQDYSELAGPTVNTAPVIATPDVAALIQPHIDAINTSIGNKFDQLRDELAQEYRDKIAQLPASEKSASRAGLKTSANAFAQSLPAGTPRDAVKRNAKHLDTFYDEVCGPASTAATLAAQLRRDNAKTQALQRQIDTDARLARHLAMTEANKIAAQRRCSNFDAGAPSGAPPPPPPRRKTPTQDSKPRSSESNTGGAQSSAQLAYTPNTSFRPSQLSGGIVRLAGASKDQFVQAQVVQGRIIFPRHLFGGGLGGSKVDNIRDVIFVSMLDGQQTEYKISSSQIHISHEAIDACWTTAPNAVRSTPNAFYKALTRPSVDDTILSYSYRFDAKEGKYEQHINNGKVRAYHKATYTIDGEKHDVTYIAANVSVVNGDCGGFVTHTTSTGDVCIVATPVYYFNKEPNRFLLTEYHVSKVTAPRAVA